MLPDGRTVAAFIFNQPSHGLHPGDVECWISGDGGQTWELRSAVTRHEGDSVRVNCAAGLDKNGELVAVVSGWSSTQTKASGQTPRRTPLSPWLCRSSDAGKTWSVDR